MTIPLYYVLQINYPTANIGLHGNVQLVNHGAGKGDQISEWQVPGIAQPTAAQLTAYQTDANTVAAWQAIQNTWANKDILDQLDALDLKSIRAIRAGDNAIIAQHEAQAVALRAQLLPMTAAGVIAKG